MAHDILDDHDVFLPDVLDSLTVIVSAFLDAGDLDSAAAVLDARAKIGAARWLGTI
jgi:hypothetical protein